MSQLPVNHEPTRTIRIGTIVTPQQFVSMVSSNDEQTEPRHALVFYAPAHIVGAFQAPGQTLSHRVAVHSTDEGFEHVMLMTIQRAGVVLHCLLPLSDSAVKAYVSDCIARQSIRLILAMEDSARFAVMDVESPVGSADRFDEVMQTARPNPEGAQMLVDMTKEFLELPPAPPWVLSTPVQHLFAVLAGNGVASALSRARGATAH